MAPRSVVLVALLMLPGADARAWPAELLVSLSRDAGRLLPASLRRLLYERERQVLEEAARFPPELGQSLAADLFAGELRPATTAGLEAHAASSLELFRTRRVSDGLVSMGALLRIPADLSDPALSAGPGGFPPGVVREYYAFVEANLDKIPVVLEDAAALRLTRAELPAYWRGILARSHAQSPVLLAELYRDGRLVDHRTLDYRSPVFGVASLSYSRAVTSIAATWLAVWREARGDMSRMPAAREVKPRASEVPEP